MVKNSKNTQNTCSSRIKGQFFQKEAQGLPGVGREPAWGASSGVRVENFMTEGRRGAPSECGYSKFE